LPIAAVSALWLLAVVLFTSGLPAAKAQSYETRLKERLATVDQVTTGISVRPGSLGRYRVPEWYRDAKFGTFIYWGVFSAPACAAKLHWQQSKQGLTISLPPTKPNDTAYVFSISGTGGAGTAKTN
jgi:hypothetical protein